LYNPNNLSDYSTPPKIGITLNNSNNSNKIQFIAFRAIPVVGFRRYWLE